jgi:hypothetical protein
VQLKTSNLQNVILNFLTLFNKFSFLKNPSLQSSGFLFLLTSLFFQSTMASLAPRMRSVLVQLSGGYSQFTLDPNSDYFYQNGSIDILYLNRRGPSFGLRAVIENRNTTATVENGNSFGVFIGFVHQKGAFLLAGYESQSTLGRWKNGTGSFVELGYLEHIGSQIHVGVKYTSRNITYGTDKMDVTATRRAVTDTYPSLILAYSF